VITDYGNSLSCASGAVTGGRYGCDRSVAPGKSDRLQHPAAADVIGFSKAVHFVADCCNALGYALLQQSCRATSESQRFPPSHKYAPLSDWAMLLAMRDSAYPFPSMPKCSRAIATAQAAAPAPFVLVYTNVVWCERVPVTTVVRNFDGGNLVVSGRLPPLPLNFRLPDDSSRRRRHAAKHAPGASVRVEQCPLSRSPTDDRKHGDGAQEPTPALPDAGSRSHARKCVKRS